MSKRSIHRPFNRIFGLSKRSSLVVYSTNGGSWKNKIRNKVNQYYKLRTYDDSNHFECDIAHINDGVNGYIGYSPWEDYNWVSNKVQIADFV